MSFKLQHKLLTVILVLSVHAVAQSDTLARFVTGTKSQTYNTSAQEQLGTSPLGLLVMVDFEMVQKIYFSMGTSFELSTESYSTSGFTLYGSVLYYFYGEPRAVVTEDVDTSMELYQKYSVYGGLGIFQKEIKVRNPETESTDDESLGGLILTLGANYNLSPKLFFNGQIQALNSGLGTEAEYSSFELYLGLGLRI